MPLSREEIDSIAEPLYDAYRLGKYGEQEYLPMWHELDHQQPPNSLELKRVLDAVESIIADRDRAAARKAWDEGYYAGTGADRDTYYWPENPGGTNPYGSDA